MAELTGGLCTLVTRVVRTSIPALLELLVRAAHGAMITTVAFELSIQVDGTLFITRPCADIIPHILLNFVVIATLTTSRSTFI